MTDFGEDDEDDDNLWGRWWRWWQILGKMMKMMTTCGGDDEDDDRLWGRAEKGRKRTTWLADDDGCEDGTNKKPNIQNILNVKSGYQPRSASKSDTSTRQLIFPTNITKNLFSLAANKAPIHLLSIEKWNLFIFSTQNRVALRELRSYTL